MARNIEDVEGIGAAYAQKLAAAGVHTDADMLERTGSAKGRAQLALQTGISESLILKWANHVDLMRISGIGPQFAELLEASGVDTVKELAQRNPAHLTLRLAIINQERRRAGTSPAESQVSDWINQARQLSEQSRGEAAGR
jgi:predicted flap endonuclease-1-like 5' DNA nuclease